MNKMKNYTKWCLIPILIIIIIIGCDERDGLTSPPIFTTPTVKSTNPINMSTGITSDNIITATFSEVMDSLT